MHYQIVQYHLCLNENNYLFKKKDANQYINMDIDRYVKINIIDCISTFYSAMLNNETILYV